MIGVRFRVRARKEGLSRAPQILRKNLRAGLEGLGKRLETSARSRMRRDTGQSQRSLRSSVTGSGISLNLRVVSQLVQAFVDAYGLKKGVFPDFAVNSRLYTWTVRRVKKIPTKAVAIGPVPRGRFRRKVRSIRRVTVVSGPALLSKRARIQHSDAKRLAFLVARAIFRKGIAATHWNRRTLEANRSRITRDVQNAITRSVNEMKRG